MRVFTVSYTIVLDIDDNNRTDEEVTQFVTDYLRGQSHNVYDVKVADITPMCEQ